MRGKWQVWLFHYALKRACRKPAPDRIPLSSNDRKINYIVPKISASEGVGFDILVDSVQNSSITGRQWGGARYERECSLPIRYLSEAELEVRHYYRGITINYDGVSDFLFGEFTFLSFRAYFWETFSQVVFNSTTRFRHDRVDILRRLVNRHVAKSKDTDTFPGMPRGVSIVGLFHDIYSVRVFGHPRFGIEAAQFELLVESLVSSGDMEQEGGVYTITPQAVETIANYELQERRHRISKMQNWIMVALTTVIAISTAIGAYYKGP